MNEIYYTLFEYVTFRVSIFRFFNNWDIQTKLDDIITEYTLGTAHRINGTDQGNLHGADDVHGAREAGPDVEKDPNRSTELRAYKVAMDQKSSWPDILTWS